MGRLKSTKAEAVIHWQTRRGDNDQAGTPQALAGAVVTGRISSLGACPFSEYGACGARLGVGKTLGQMPLLKNFICMRRKHRE